MTFDSKSNHPIEDKNSCPVAIDSSWKEFKKILHNLSLCQLMDYEERRKREK